MKVIDSIWFTPFGSIKLIGIILAVDEITEEEKAYIGFGDGIFSQGQKEDEEKIINEGAHFPIKCAKMLMGRS